MTKIEVRVSTAGMADAAASGKLLIYLIKQGGSWFQNERGQRFVAAPGAVVVGSQAAGGKVAPAPGPDAGSQLLSVPEHFFVLSAHSLRRGGFQLVAKHMPMHGLLSSYVVALCRDLPTLGIRDTAAALRALDQLLAAALRAEPRAPAELAQTLAKERLRAALHHIEAHIESPQLSPASVASSLGISSRQLHRVFESGGVSLSAQIRRLRSQRAKGLLVAHPGLPVTEVAMRCGFESLDTFYRALKSEFGMTASDIRRAAADGADRKPPRAPT